MFRGSKAIKDSTSLKGCGCPPKSKSEDSKIKKILLAIDNFFKFNIYYPIDSFVVRTSERIKRSLSWARFTWLNYDFDSAYLFDVMQFKLTRIHKCLKHGIAVQEKEDMDALKEAIGICKRLHEQKYEYKYCDAHDKKWGRMKTKTVPCKFDEKGEPTHYSWQSSRSKAKTAKQQKQERKEFLACFKNAEHDRVKDIQRLCDIFKKHERSWWE